MLHIFDNSHVLVEYKHTHQEAAISILVGDDRLAVDNGWGIGGT